VSSFFKDADFGGEEAVRYDYDNGSFYAGLGLIQDKHEAQNIGKDGQYFDVKVGYRVDDFDLTAFYGDAELKGKKLTVHDDESLLALEVRFAGVENLNLEFGYYTVDSKLATGAKKDTDTIAFAADYTMGKTTFAGGVASIDKSVVAEEDYVEWFLNTGYGIAPNTTVYVEIGDNDKKHTDLGYGVGIKASF
ncbi:MAG: porin, partial [Pseudomonadota bacterium]|nr:porin [Pseudomonadota bacterium]